MTGAKEVFPREVFDHHGIYTVLQPASYLVHDSRIRELAEIGYAHRDLDKAHAFITACTSYVEDDRDILGEEAHWAAAVVYYAKPFGPNNARSHFDAKGFVASRLDPDGLKMHEFIRRCRSKWIAHDDGLGESKSVAINLAPSPPRSFMEVGLHQPARRVVSLGTDIARRLEPHFARVRDLLRDQESRRRDQLGIELVRSGFSGVQLMGLAVEEDLISEFNALLPSGGTRAFE